MMFEGANKSFDQAICFGFDINENDINDLCDNFYNTAVNNCYSEEAKYDIKKPTKTIFIHGENLQQSMVPAGVNARKKQKYQIMTTF